MAIYRAQIAFSLDSALPRDVMTINPHYQGDNAQGLADALKTNLMANTHVGVNPFSIKIYDAQKAPPNYPLASASQIGTPPASVAPREVALCLSYYSSFNRPSYRGRLYLPHLLFGGAMALRPTSTQRTDAGAMATTLGKNLPSQHTWSVFSHKLNMAFTINNWWVDDEWDIVRSRGLRGTARTTGVIP